MSFFHSRCETIEALLKGRIGDLEADNDRLRELREEEMKEAGRRERELLDQLMAVMDPARARAAQAAVRPHTPPVSAPLRPRTTGLPGQHQSRPASATAVAGPLSTPVESGYRPARERPAQERQTDASLSVPERQAALQEMKAAGRPTPQTVDTGVHPDLEPAV